MSSKERQRPALDASWGQYQGIVHPCTCLDFHLKHIIMVVVMKFQYVLKYRQSQVIERSFIQL